MQLTRLSREPPRGRPAARGVVVLRVLAGTGALKPDDLPPRSHLTPWHGGIFVAPEHRGRGVARAIVNRLVGEARRLQLAELYLWTPSAASLYAKLGWTECEKLEYCGQTITVMVRQLEPAERTR